MAEVFFAGAFEPRAFEPGAFEADAFFAGDFFEGAFFEGVFFDATFLPAAFFFVAGLDEVADEVRVDEEGLLRVTVFVLDASEVFVVGFFRGEALRVVARFFDAGSRLADFASAAGFLEDDDRRPVEASDSPAEALALSAGAGLGLGTPRLGRRNRDGAGMPGPLPPSR